MPSPQWPSWWFLDLPWASVCSLSATAAFPTGHDKLPRHVLVGTLLSMLPDTNVLACLRPLMTPSLQHLFNALSPVDGRSVWVIPGSLRSLVTFTEHERVALLESLSTPSLPNPGFSHWYITTGPHSTATMAKIQLGALRRYIGIHPRLCFAALCILPCVVHCIYCLLLASGVVFLTLCMPAKAFTPWWRLLHGHLSTQAHLHTMNCTKYTSPLCKLCTEAPEDDYHMVVGCDMKSLFWSEVKSLSWSEVISHLGLSDKFPTDDAIWIGLTTLHDQDHNPLDTSILELLGVAFSSLWQHHWCCVLEDKSWLTRIVFSSFLADHTSLTSSFLDV